MPGTAAVKVSTTPTLDSVRIEARHPSAFLADVVNSFRSVDPCVVLPEDAQRGLLFMLKACGLLLEDPHRDATLPSGLPREDIHLNPANSTDYRSSSWDNRKGKFVVKAGGFGAPQSVDGSFSHSHTDPDFKALHPTVDLSTYKSKARNADQSEHPLPTQPTLPLNYSFRATTPPGSDATVADTDELDVGVYIKEESEEPAAYSLFEDAPEDDAVDRDVALPSTDAHDDSGIVLDEVSASETQRTDNASAARKTPDSGYDTQPHGISHGRDPASADSTPSDVTGSVTADEKSQSPTQARKKLVPKVSHAPRRSSRLGTVDTPPESTSTLTEPVTPTEPTSSLGKHSRKEFEDAAHETTTTAEPEAKRSKDSRD